MLKILNTFQIKEWDLYTINNEPIASIDLMERACQAFVHWYAEKFNTTKKVGIVCGTGNNGGDGLGIARLLSEWGYNVKVWIIKGAVPESIDFCINKKRLPDKVSSSLIKDKPDVGIFKNCDVIIDGIFGSGLSRKLEGVYADVVNEINKAAGIVVAIDIPSGVFADKPTESESVHADFTVTFQTPKLSFLFPENENRVGLWEAIHIGLSNSFLKEASTSNYLIDKKYVRIKIPIRKKFAHKGDFGRALLIAGSEGKMGACVLAAKAAMRSGVGLLTTHVPRCGYSIIQTAVPEAMTSVDQDQICFGTAPNIDVYSAIGIGPGLGLSSDTINAFKNLLQNVEDPIVVDADGINILASDSSMIHLLPANSLLTPHPGELERLIGGWKNDFDKLEKVREFAAQTKCIIIIKGAYSAIVSPNGQIFFNSTGNPGMATGGSGDVLTGILTGLLAQKINPLDVAIIGIYVHGLAGDLAKFELGQVALMASDIIDYLPQAFKEVSS
ncbi:MAG TPA: NAD(P)H-hydrate dehydratase [Cyclobacteriaceae bacterium]